MVAVSISGTGLTATLILLMPIFELQLPGMPFESGLADPPSLCPNALSHEDNLDPRTIDSHEDDASSRPVCGRLDQFAES